MQRSRFLRALLLAACLLLAVPTLATAKTFTVDSILDQPDQNPGDEVCETEASTCTLRAAIETSNQTPEANTIEFDSSFEGKGVNTIQPNSPLPPILQRVTIDGDGAGQCDTAAGAPGPCVGVEGEQVFVVLADHVTIEGIAIGGGAHPGTLEVELQGAEGFTARDDWFGVTLEGNPTGAGVAAMVGPGSDDATFGGSAAADRDVFAYNEEGLVVQGASGTKVEGDYFGLEPDGTTAAENNRDLAVADQLANGPTPADPATNTTVVANVFASKRTSAAAIDLSGAGLLDAGPATGPTAIEGNKVGLDATGAAMAEAANAGIRVGAAGSVTIGGPLPAQANRINGGVTAIVAGQSSPSAAAAKRLMIEGNLIGRNLAGDAALSPPSFGVSVSSPGVTGAPDQAVIAANSISATEIGIETVASGASVLDNAIEGGEEGIVTEGSTKSPDLPNLIEGNTVTNIEGDGIRVQNDGNGIFGNEVVATEGSGIAVEAESAPGISGNRIGGDSEASENVISRIEGFPINIESTEASRNEVGRDRGDENGAVHGFIRLAGLGSEGDPNGLKHPHIKIAAKTEASGEAVPGATVRVFRKATSSPAEIAGYLGKATADSNGAWKVTYAAVPGETIIAATQTKEGGTSELSESAVTPADPSPPPPQQGGTNPTGGSTSSGSTSSAAGSPPPAPGPPAPMTKPKVSITAAPKSNSSATTATFKFKANESGSKFQCKLDGKSFASCRSPKTYKQLKPGKHVFKVKATDPAGNVSPIVTRTFTVGKWPMVAFS